MWGIIIALIIALIIVCSIFSALAEKVGGWGRLLAIIGGIVLLIILFVNFSWAGILILLGIAVGIVVLLLVLALISDIIQKHDKAKKETAETKLKFQQEERKKREEEAFYAEMRKSRHRTSSNEPDIERPSSKMQSNDYFKYTDIPMVNGTCDVSGEPESFRITFLTNDNHKITFDVNSGQISTYSFLSRAGKKVGCYEVG